MVAFCRAKVDEALESVLALALSLISVPGRIYGEPALASYRAAPSNAPGGNAASPDLDTPLHLLV